MPISKSTSRRSKSKTMVRIPDQRTPSRKSKRTKNPARGGRQTMARVVSDKAKAETVTKTFRRRGASDHGVLPSWKELEHRQNRRRKKEGRSNLFLETVSTARMALLIIALAAGFTIYVGHVHATQELLSMVQQLRTENTSLHLKYNRIKGRYDKLTGPETIHRRARALGLREGFAFGEEVRFD